MPIKDGSIVILSYSAFSLWSTCPMWYYREKILREPTPEGDDSFNVPGLIAHSASEIYLKDGIEGVFREDIVKATLNLYNEKPKIDLANAYGSYEKALEFTLKCVNNMYQLLIGRGYREKDNFLCEAWFGNWTDPLMLSDILGTQGASDLIEKNANGTGLLTDYKATWSTKNLNKDQLILYEIAAEKKWGIPIAMSEFFLIPTGKHCWFNFTQRDRDDLLRRMNHAAERILKGDFPTTPSKKCERCPFASTCDNVYKDLPEAPKIAATSNIVFPSFGDIQL